MEEFFKSIPKEFTEKSDCSLNYKLGPVETSFKANKFGGKLQGKGTTYFDSLIAKEKNKPGPKYDLTEEYRYPMKKPRGVRHPNPQIETICTFNGI